MCPYGIQGLQTASLASTHSRTGSGRPLRPSPSRRMEAASREGSWRDEVHCHTSLSALTYWLRCTKQSTRSADHSYFYAHNSSTHGHREISNAYACSNPYGSLHHPCSWIRRIQVELGIPVDLGRRLTLQSGRVCVISLALAGLGSFSTALTTA